MATNEKSLKPTKALDVSGRVEHDRDNDKRPTPGASSFTHFLDNSDEEETFVECSDDTEPMVDQVIADGPSTDTRIHGMENDQTISETEIMVSYDSIAIRLTNTHNSEYYKLYCKDTVGIMFGSIFRSFTPEDNQCIMRPLRENTEYVIEIQKFLKGVPHISKFKARTLFCSPPHDVNMDIKRNEVTFKWKAPLTCDQTLTISEYIFEARNYVDGEVNTFAIKPPKLKISCRLENNCSYQFTLYAKAGNLDGCRMYQERIHLKHRLCEICDNVGKKKGRAMYLLKPSDIKQREECVTEKNFGDAGLYSDITDENVLLLVGETGTGKTTWMNAFVNFLFGVTRDDPFRFKLIEEKDEDSQTESKTQCVTIYRLPHQKGMAVKYGVTLIDTPGFGDTRGIDQDTRIETAIHVLFGRKNGYLEYINGVAFVMPSNTSRLTPTMKYILDSITSLFGKDLKGNLILLGTHGTAKPTKALNTLKKHNIEIRKPYHFENAEVLSTKYNEDSKGGSNQLWLNTMKMFNDLAADLQNMPKKSVSQTQDVLDERERIKLHVANLRMRIQCGITILEQFQKEHDYLQGRNNEPKCNTTRIIPYIEIKYIQDEDGQLHNNCEKCKVTCHAACRDVDAENCIAMESRTDEAHCTVCINECSWHFHSLQPCTIRHIAKNRLANEKDIENRYLQTDEKLTRDEVCVKLKDDFKAVSCRVKASISTIDGALKKLEKIALLSWPKSQIDYIDTLMAGERQEMKEGYKDRLKLLDDLKQEAKRLQSIDSGKFDPFGQYRKLIKEVIEAGCDATKTSTLAKYFDRFKCFWSGGK